MNREIKFRIWDDAPIKDGLNGLMINYEYAIQSSYLTEALNGKYPIMQYTGLKDKNGVEIYEGDILNFRANYTIQPCGYFNGVVELTPYGIVLNVGGREYNALDEMEGLDYNSEIIGNIHENPELLK